MKSAKKVAIRVSVLLILAGLIIGVVALMSIKFNFSELNTMEFVTNTYFIDEAFNNIYVEGAECDVRLILTEDEKCKVDCSEGDKISHSVTVENDTLKIIRNDNRDWYEYTGVYWGRMEIAVYLPKSEFDSLYVMSLSGDIDIPADFAFDDAELHNSSGEVRFKAEVSEDLLIKTISGDIYAEKTCPKSLTVNASSGNVTLEGITLETDLAVTTVSGDIAVEDIECGNVNIETSSGEVVFSKLLAEENIHIETISGDVDLLKSDAETLWIRTSSGEVFGTLLTEKIFVTSTSSGEVDVPGTASGGKCEIKTVSGDIKFSIE